MAARTEPGLRSSTPAVLPNVYGLRVINQIGPHRVVATLVVGWLLFNVILAVTVSRPDLLDQTAIGTDSSNYYAAGLRLNDGHPMYRLSPGDRPVPLLPPPHSDAALLSPPLLGVVWRPLALLGDASMILWWVAGISVLGAMAVWMILHGSLRRNAVVLLIAPCIALAMWSGNVNPFIVALLVSVWAAASRGRSGLAGGLLAVAAGLKLTPLWLLWWFVVRRDVAAIKGFVATGVVVALISLAGAGLENHVEYLNVIRHTATMGFTEWSLPGMLRSLGFRFDALPMMVHVWLVLGLASVWFLRHRPRAAFSVAILTVLYSSPVVLLGNIAVLLAGTAPFPARRPAAFPAPRRDITPGGHDALQQAAAPGVA